MELKWRNGAVGMQSGTVGALCLLSLDVFPHSMWKWFGFTEESFGKGVRQKLAQEISRAIAADMSHPPALRSLEELLGSRQADLLGSRLEMFATSRLAHDVQWWVRTLGDLVESQDLKIAVSEDNHSYIVKVWDEEVEDYLSRFFALKSRIENRQLSERENRLLRIGNYRWFRSDSTKAGSADCWATLHAALNQVSCETALRRIRANLSVSELSHCSEIVRPLRNRSHLPNLDLDAEKVMAFRCNLARPEQE